MALLLSTAPLASAAELDLQAAIAAGKLAEKHHLTHADRELARWGGRELERAVEWVIRAGRNDLLEEMLAAGLSTAWPPPDSFLDRESPLAWAVWSKNERAARLLVAKGAPVDVAGRFNPLHLALDLEADRLAVFLLDHKANPNSQAAGGQTPLHVAVARHSLAMAKLLISRGARIDTRGIQGQTPLRLALGDDRMAQFLLSMGADPNAADSTGWTALHELAADPIYHPAGEDKCPRAGFSKLAGLLLSHGARVDLTDRNGRTPLWLAAAKGCPALVRLFLDHGAQVNRPDAEGRTPLHAAAEAAAPSTVRLLMSRGADVQARGRDGWTPLHRAAGGREAWVDYCPIQDSMFQTWKSVPGHDKVLSMLLKEKADPNAKTKEGATALEIARARSRSPLPRCPPSLRRLHPEERPRADFDHVISTLEGVTSR